MRISALEYRYARPDDVSSINELVARSIRSLHAGSYSDAIISEAIEHAYGVDWQLVRDQTYLVATAAGVLVGAGGWSYRGTIAGAHGPNDPEPPVLTPGVDAARIRAFYIDPDFARHGIGRELLAISEQAAYGAGFRQAELTSTRPAVPFYLAFGYGPKRDFDLPLPSGAQLRLRLMTKKLEPRAVTSRDIR